MKMKKIKYKIDQRNEAPKEVEGYAVASELPVRFCVRKFHKHYWRGDHYDTGLSLSSWGRTRAEAAARTFVLIRDGIESGDYQRALANAGFAP